MLFGFGLEVIEDCRDVFKRIGYKTDSLGLDIARALSHDKDDGQ